MLSHSFHFKRATKQVGKTSFIHLNSESIASQIKACPESYYQDYGQLINYSLFLFHISTPPISLLNLS